MCTASLSNVKAHGIRHAPDGVLCEFFPFAVVVVAVVYVIGRTDDSWLVYQEVPVSVREGMRLVGRAGSVGGYPSTGASQVRHMLYVCVFVVVVAVAVTLLLLIFSM